MQISLQELRRILSYDKKTGILRWKIRRPRVFPGRRAGWQHEKGARYIEVNGVEYLEHRLIWFYVTGEDPENYIDHKNRQRNDNRWKNLRKATHSQNQVNTVNANPLHHIEQRGSLWRVRVAMDRKRLCQSFCSKEEAIIARERFISRLHGEFAP